MRLDWHGRPARPAGTRKVRDGGYLRFANRYWCGVNVAPYAGQWVRVEMRRDTSADDGRPVLSVTTVPPGRYVVPHLIGLARLIGPW
jgi:hypothetical protein